MLFEHPLDLPNIFQRAEKKYAVHSKSIEKYARQIGSFPQVGVNIKNIWNHHPGYK